MKTCKCGETDLSKFGKHKQAKDGLRSTCKKCHNIANTTARIANPEVHRKANLAYARSPEGRAKHRANQLRRKYWPDLTNEQATAEYNRLLALQKNCCGLCGKHQSQFKIALAVDHQKYPHKVRGLLCNICNRFEVGRHTLESVRHMLTYFETYK